RQHPVAALEQIEDDAEAAAGDRLARDPRRARRHADLICALASDHRAGRVRAVLVVVARRGRWTGRRRVPPVVVVIERASALTAPVMFDERGMRKLDTRVEARDDDALAGDTASPDFRRAHLRNV